MRADYDECSKTTTSLKVAVKTVVSEWPSAVSGQSAQIRSVNVDPGEGEMVVMW